ncbi:unnamed protein product, partial [Rotaria sp. Silwood2]
PKRESKDYSKIYKVKNVTEILRRNFQKNYNFARYGTINESYKVRCLCDPITGYLFNYQIYLGKEETSGKETPLGEHVVFHLMSGHKFPRETSIFR